MKPVWIKYYGLIPMTRRGYLLTTTIAGVLAAGIFAAAFASGYLPPLSTLWQPVKLEGPPALVWVYNHLYWIILVCLVLEVIDIYTVLRRFAQKEAEQRERLSGARPGT
jgi:hypothetical protein